MPSALILILHLALQSSYNISTIAGSEWVGENVPASSAVLIQAEGIVTDSLGNIYISDAANHRVRCISTNGVIRTIAGNGIAGFQGDGGPASDAQLNSPYGLAFDYAGNLYIADLGNARVRRISPIGIITTVAGGGALPAGGKNEGTIATMLALTTPRNIAIDSADIVYISDFGAHRVYKMTTDGTLTTLAGTGLPGYSPDGVAALSPLNYPTALAIDRQGSVYIADSGNHLVRKVSGGIITSIARSPLPTGLAFDGLATLYAADHSSGQILEIPLSSGTTAAMNVSATDVTFGKDGNLYVADVTVARRIGTSGIATIIAGGGNLAEGDSGPAIDARLNHPSGIAADLSGNLYIADQANNRIRRVGLDGTITTVAGTGTSGNAGDGGAATVATLNAPASVTFDTFFNLYIADTGNARIRKVTPAGVILPVATGTLTAPAYMMFDKLQNLYIADASAIFKVSSAGAISTVIGGLKSPHGMAFDTSGNFYFSEPSLKQVWMIAPSGAESAVAPGAWNAPQGIAVDVSGNILVADSGSAQILSINSFGHVTPIAGSGVAGFAGDGGAAPLAQLNAPTDVLATTSGIYIADAANNRIRELQASITIVPGMLLTLNSVGSNVSQVLFGQIAAPVVAVSQTGAMVRVPVSLEGLSTVQISIPQMPPVIGNIVDAAPTLFGSIVNQDGSINNPSNPAARGSVISVFGTGEGVTGLPFSITIGGVTANIIYAGPSNFPGMFQINAQLPSGYFAGGTLPVVVSVGTFAAPPATVTVF